MSTETFLITFVALVAWFAFNPYLARSVRVSGHLEEWLRNRRAIEGPGVSHFIPPEISLGEARAFQRPAPPLKHELNFWGLEQASSQPSGAKAASSVSSSLGRFNQSIEEAA